MAKIVVDGVTYEVNGSNNLLQECLSQGLDLPYFCWHPCMGSVGACRQCAVKQYRNEEDETGTLVMACMTPASDGSIISINDEQAKKFRASVIESLMISHPHDCPVCEEGGECHLQDMTLMSGHNYRRYDRKKVTHRNQYLGPFIGHEMNRCITCYRCVRYYNDYAGGTDLSAQASHHHTYFGRQSDGCLESEFSGNLVEVCPTGVFTDATFSAHYSRKWDLQTAPSVCVGCSVGCNTTPGERYGELRRVVNRYHGDINGYFLCDRGRFGYGFVNSSDRLVASQSGKGEQRQPLGAEEAKQNLEQQFNESAGRMLGIGSPRASIEANYALMQRVGAENFYAGFSDEQFDLIHVMLELMADPKLHVPSLREVEDADAILVVGEDVTNTAPRIALALRQSVRNRADELAGNAGIPLWQDAAVRELAQHELAPLYLLAGHATRLDDVARTTVVDCAAGLTQLAAGIAGKLDAGAPPAAGEFDDSQAQLINRVAEDLRQARRPLIVCGSGSGSADLLKAAANVALALAACRDQEQSVDFCCVAPEANSVGLALLADKEQTLGSALNRMQAGEVQAAIVLENDLYARAPAQAVDSAIEGTARLVAVDQLTTRTTDRADLVLACSSFAEQKSCYVNYEGRAQLSMQVFISKHDCQPAWKWLSDDPGKSHDDLLRECDAGVTTLKGVVSVLPEDELVAQGMKFPRQSHRYSGRTATQAAAHVHESRQPQDSDSVMAFSMEGVSSQKDATVISSAWAPGWNSNQSVSKFQDEVGGHLRQGNPGKLLLSKLPASAGYRSDLQLSPGMTTGAEAGAFTVIPAYQLFGSDELSNRSEVVAQRLVGSYTALSPADAGKLDLQSNGMLELQTASGSASYPVCIRSSVKPGTVVVFTSAGEFSLARPGESVRLSKAAGTGQGRFDNLIVSDLQQEGA